MFVPVHIKAQFTGFPSQLGFGIGKASMIWSSVWEDAGRLVSSWQNIQSPLSYAIMRCLHPVELETGDHVWALAGWTLAFLEPF